MTYLSKTLVRQLSASKVFESFNKQFPTPAVAGAAKLAKDGNSSTAVPYATNIEHNQEAPGTLPECSNLSKAGRALLLRLLEKEPRHRMRSLRMLQQSAFYLGFNFDHIKIKKISPKNVLEQITVASSLVEYNKNDFIGFDQANVV